MSLFIIILLIVAAICGFLSTIGVPSKINLAGMGVLILALILLLMKE